MNNDLICNLNVNELIFQKLSNNNIVQRKVIKNTYVNSAVWFEITFGDLDDNVTSVLSAPTTIQFNDIKISRTLDQLIHTDIY